MIDNNRFGSTIMRIAAHAFSGVRKRQYSSAVKHRTGGDIISRCEVIRYNDV